MPEQSKDSQGKTPEPEANTATVQPDAGKKSAVDFYTDFIGSEADRKSIFQNGKVEE